MDKIRVRFDSHSWKYPPQYDEFELSVGDKVIELLGSYEFVPTAEVRTVAKILGTGTANPWLKMDDGGTYRLNGRERGKGDFQLRKYDAAKLAEYQEARRVWDEIAGLVSQIYQLTEYGAARDKLAKKLSKPDIRQAAHDFLKALEGKS